MRGCIHFVTLPKQIGITSVEQGIRPVVVVSSHAGNMTSDIVMCCPITTKIKPISCNVNIGWNLRGRPSQVLCNQIVTLPKDALGERVGYITLEEQKAVDIAMCIALGINIDYSEVKDYAGKL